MSLESQVAELVNKTSQLLQRVTTQADEWDAQVQAKINELETWRQEARGEYPAVNLLKNPYFNILNDDGFPKGWNLINNSWGCTHSFGANVPDLTFEILLLAPAGSCENYYWPDTLRSKIAEALGVEIRKCGALRGSMKILVFHGKTRTECHCSFQISQYFFNWSRKVFSAGCYVYCNRWDLLHGIGLRTGCVHARWGGVVYTEGTEGVLKVITINRDMSIQRGIRGFSIGAKFKQTDTPQEFTIAFVCPWLVCGYSEDFVPPALTDDILEAIWS